VGAAEGARVSAALEPRPGPVAAGLRLYVSGGALLFALPAEPVERLLLADEARLTGGADPRPPASLGVLAVGRLAYSAWDLSLLLGRVPQPEAWVLLRLPRAGGPLPLALRTGACVAVRPLPPRVYPLPAGLGRVRPRLFDAAFPVSGLGRVRGAAGVGLSLQLKQLWREDELVHAEAELREAVLA
jgi:hypothetical protein